MSLGEWYHENSKVQQTKEYPPRNERHGVRQQKGNASSFEIDGFNSNDMGIDEIA